MKQKRAVGYVRISTTDQSTHSIGGQKEYITRHCEKQGWDLLDIYEDEGQSAKNFDRGNWRELELFLKKNHKDIDYLVVAKYDRFSRNVSEALNKIEEIEKKYRIHIISVMEPIGLHPSSPYYFRFRTEMLLSAQVELMMIKDRTKFGLVQKARSGQHTTLAPYGYKNVRESKKLTLLIQEPEKAKLVQEAFTLFSQGISMAEVRRMLQKKGLPAQGNSFMQRMLSNPVYTGLIRVPAYYDDPEELIEGRHEAIIDRVTWWRVQGMLSNRSISRVVYNDEVPLRGVLHCHCGRALTAGNSRSKSGRYYWYYRCNEHLENMNANKLHEQFEAIVSELSFSTEQIQELQARTAKIIEKNLQQHTQDIAAKKKELADICLKLESLEEKYIANDIDKPTYSKWQVRYMNEKISLEKDIAHLSMPVRNVWAMFNEKLEALQQLHILYNRSDIYGKQSFIKLVFEDKLRYENGIYRTPYMLPLFRLKAALLEEKGLLVLEQPRNNFKEIVESSEDGNSIEHFEGLQKTYVWAQSFKKAA